MKVHYPSLIISLVGFIDILLQSLFGIKLPDNTANVAVEVVGLGFTIYGVFKNHFTNKATTPPPVTPVKAPTTTTTTSSSTNSTSGK